MTCFTEAGGSNEIQAMSLLYKRDVILFNGQKQTCKQLTNHGFTDYIRLCYTPQKQYESVYSKDFVMEAGFCQCKYHSFYDYVFMFYFSFGFLLIFMLCYILQLLYMKFCIKMYLIRKI